MGSGNVSKIDITTNEVAATVSVGKSPSGVAFDGTQLWVTISDDDSVTKILMRGLK
jgi:YVTN family beta-propeller protein